MTKRAGRFNRTASWVRELLGASATASVQIERAVQAERKEHAKHVQMLSFDRDKVGESRDLWTERAKHAEEQVLHLQSLLSKTNDMLSASVRREMTLQVKLQEAQVEGEQWAQKANDGRHAAAVMARQGHAKRQKAATQTVAALPLAALVEEPKN